MPHHHESTHSSFILLATSATGPHPFPSRTRSLSLSAPMVLRLRGRGRVGRRQLLYCRTASSTDVAHNRSTETSSEAVVYGPARRFCLTSPAGRRSFSDDLAHLARNLDRAPHPHGARDRPRHRQHHLHLDSGREVARR